MRETSPHGTFSYRPGEHYVICDECGFKYRSTEVQERWDKAVVCSKCFEPRHPQESVRYKREKISISPSESEDVYITTPITQDDL